jgi:hypothetical protein
MKYNKIILSFIILGLLTFYACGEKSEKIEGFKQSPSSGNQIKDGTESTPEEPSGKIEEKVKMDFEKNNTQQVNYKQQADNYNTQDKRMIIRSGTMNVEVEKYDDSEAKVKEIAQRFNGYITNSQASLNANGKKQGTITIRIPANQFDAAVTEIAKIGKTMNQNITGKDVTEEYMDAEARMKTQQELESRLLKLLAEKTARLTDVVEVEQKLANVRENIEKTQGRMRYLKDQASFSTLAVSLYEPSLLQTSSGGGFFYEIEQGFSKGLRGFTTVVSGLIMLLIALLPVLIILYIIYWFVRRYFKKRKLAQNK